MYVYICRRNDYTTAKAARSFKHACKLLGWDPDDPEVECVRSVGFNSLWEREEW